MNLRIEAAPTAADGELSFQPDRLARIAELESSHFWFAGRRTLVERMLERHVDRPVAAALDVGCGTGSFLPVLEAYAHRVIGVDPLADPTDKRIVAADAARLPFADESFDLATALDVLEHVDDRHAVHEVARVLRPGGWAIVTVPAIPRLWSARDLVAGHRRRYRRRELVDLFESAGFVVAETRYYQFFLFPALVLSRLLARARPNAAVLEEEVPRALNSLLRQVAQIEVRLGSRIRWPWGSTLALAAVRQPV